MQPLQKLHQFLRDTKVHVDELGNILIEGFHYLAIFVIGASIMVSAVYAISNMWTLGDVTIKDILLLFIYLELSAMVGIYFKTNAMPVRCLIYIAITALCRLLIGDIQAHHQAGAGILYVSGAVLLLGVSALLIQKQSNDD